MTGRRIASNKNVSIEYVRGRERKLIYYTYLLGIYFHDVLSNN